MFPQISKSLNKNQGSDLLEISRVKNLESSASKLFHGRLQVRDSCLWPSRNTTILFNPVFVS